MKKSTVIAALALSLVALPLSTFAAVKKTPAPTIYECTKCHMKVSAAVAKKDHYIDSMDGGKLVPVQAAPKAAKPKAAASKSSMSSMGM